ncbi:Gfo/Idh/MocA family oxidoreductase [Paenibacillus sp. MZ04-78.2]|uniref:Gfo/Idh/MocA family protein n=1 Tax=Paenibacillus sp. MZ04-78.2 TaxID=2962034 RepID=UPI0020B6BE1B|nr:Gfo/Idh/MocA family oxidoreductase [Paenibacillus sp. MZ04-78.2]MCP3775152.1 Gfo/Idh/MocA family oxidoreductase [Paenibacillus sp. MZ04-78.2]
MKRLGTALIGCGAIAGVHLQAIAKLGLADLKAVVDTDGTVGRPTAQRYGCDYYADYRDMLKRGDIDVIHVCTGHDLHAPMTVDALAAGKHVLTEKPMAENKASARTMLEAAAKHTNVQLGVIFQNRYNPASVRMKQAIDSGELGKLLCMKGIVTWHRSPQYYETAWKGRWATEGGGVLINQAIHTLDLLQWFGGEVESIKGSISTDALEGVIEVEDSAHAHLVFASGATAVFYATNAYGVNSPVELELVFEQGRLHLQGDTLFLHQNGTSAVLSEPVPNDLGEKSYWGVSHGYQIRDFYEHVLDGRPYPLNGPEGYKALRLVTDIYESSRSGQRIRYTSLLNALT